MQNQFTDLLHVLFKFTRLEVGGILGTLAVLVVYQMVTGKINIHGLLEGKGRQKGISPGRIQMLLTTLVSAFVYLSQLSSVTLSGQLPALPSIPPAFIGLLGASNLFYLGGKALPMVQNRKEP